MPKTKEQFEQIKKDRIDAILSASLFLFATKGYSAVSTDDITSYVGCSHGLLYHYFGSKEDLFHALMEQKVKTIITDIIKDIDFSGDPKTAINLLVKSLLNHLKSEDDEYACAIYLVLNLHLQRKFIPKPKNHHEKTWFDYLHEIVDKGKENGEFNDFDTKEMVVSLLSFLKGLSYNRIYLGNKFTCPDSEIVTKMIIKD